MKKKVKHVIIEKDDRILSAIAAILIFLNFLGLYKVEHKIK
jgi:hypothetical protein